MENKQENPFVIKCLSDECTVVHAGARKMSPDAIEAEIKSGTEFGKRLKQAEDEVAML